MLGPVPTGAFSGPEWGSEWQVHLRLGQLSLLACGDHSQAPAFDKKYPNRSLKGELRKCSCAGGLQGFSLAVTGGFKRE